MKYININSDGRVNNIEPDFKSGTSFKTHIQVSYKELADVFGRPNDKNDGHKTDAEWLIFTPNGVATIYNYKDGKNYLGKEGLKIVDINDWHIGGTSPGVVNWVMKALGRL